MKVFVFSVLIGFISGLYLFKKDIHRITFKSEKIKSKINNLTEDELKYFKDITLKNELNEEIKELPHKYREDIKIFVHGDYDQNMIKEVKTVVDDLNDIINPIDLYFVNNRSQSNMIVYFGNYENFINHHSGIEPHRIIKNSDGFFLNNSNSKTGTIKSSVIFINLANNQCVLDTRDAIREEITQALGFYNDTWDYPNSCFYQGGNHILNYSDIDLKLINHLYND
jgi:hypothetical protein